MAYLDRTTDPSRRTTAITAVIAIHALIAYVLVTGLAGKFVPPPHIPFVGGQIPLPPPPPPSPTPQPSQSAQPEHPAATPLPMPIPTTPPEFPASYRKPEPPADLWHRHRTDRHPHAHRRCSSPGRRCRRTIRASG